MSTNITKCLFFIVLIISQLTIGYAQPKDNSPFSQFGLGDFIDSSMPSSHGMGGLSAVYHDFFEANLDNPASLGFLQYTGLQVGAFVKKSTYERIGQKQGVWSGNLNHLSLNIPIINPLNEALERRESTFAWGTSISLRPYTQVGYHVIIEDEVDSFGLVRRDFRGEGGLYQFAWSNGMKYKNLAFGFNLTYLYGQQNFDEEIQFDELINSYNNYFLNTTSYKGFQYRLGVQYDHPLDLKEAREKGDNPTRLISFGAYYGGSTNFDTESDILKIAQNSFIGVRDTLVENTGAPGSGTLPSTFGVGLMYRRAGDFRVGVDYQSTKWSDYRNTARPDSLADVTRFAAGASWIPDANSITSYFKRVEYRAGFYTQSDPRVIEGEQVKETAFTLGASLPLIVQRNIAWFQISLDAGARKGGDRLSENFVRGKVGLIFNDNSWFIRGKYH